MTTCENCGSARKLATGIYYECRDIRSGVKVSASHHKCRYWRIIRRRDLVCE